LLYGLLRFDMKSASSTSGYSPTIAATLEVGNDRFPVAELAPSYLVLRSARVLGPMHGVVVMTIDGKPIRYPVMLPQGINPHVDRQPLLDIPASPLAEAV
jgi:hypothetical protein